MKLWLVSRNDEDMIYDAYDGHVIAAESEEEARAFAAQGAADEGKEVWSDGEKVKCELIGETLGADKGVVLSSFNAG